MWWLLGLGVLVVAGLAYDTWRYTKNTERVLELLRKRGPMTGLEISKAGVSRAHTYLILARLVDQGKVTQFPNPNPQYGGQFKYMVK
jgi:hypothetical protein